jgi:hypothetical protein
VIDVFVSRPTKIAGVHEHKLQKFYACLKTEGFNPRTIGGTDSPMRSPFDEVRDLMSQCKCSIVLGFVQKTYNIKNSVDERRSETIKLVSEWNQIETTMSLMLGLPTLVLLQKGVNPRGVFERGAASVFVHEFHPMEFKWEQEMPRYLAALKAALL